jgi:hypothetical protein
MMETVGDSYAVACIIFHRAGSARSAQPGREVFELDISTVTPPWDGGIIDDIYLG